MALNFPNSPTLNQLYSFNKKTYKWDGISWKQMNSTKERFISEYADFYSNTTSSNVTLDLRTFNNFEVAVTTNTDITVVPNGSEFSQFIMQLDYTSAGYDTSVEGFYLDTASYDNVSFSIAAQDADVPKGFFKPDGTRMYIVGRTNDAVYQYTLSTPWDLSSASYDNISFGVGARDTAPIGIFFKPDGTKMYVIGTTNDTVYQYSLSTPWEVSTASYDSVSFSVAAQDTVPNYIFFKPDGTRMYVLGGANKSVFQYSLSTPWTVDTASYDSVSFGFGAQDQQPTSIFFKSDGTKMFMSGRDNGATNRGFIYQYTLSTPWDLSSASYDNVVFNHGEAPNGVFFKPDGTKMFTFNGSTTSRPVNQYTTAAPAYHTINWSNNVFTAPNTPFLTSSSIIEFTTFDGRQWTASTLSSVTG